MNYQSIYDYVMFLLLLLEVSLKHASFGFGRQSVFLV